MYILEKIKNEIAKEINKALGKKLVQASDLVYPPNSEMGDLSFNVFFLIKETKKEPREIAKDIASKIKPSEIIKEVEVAGPYVNFFIDKEKLTKDVLREIGKEKNKYGRNKDLAGKTVMVEYTDPNPFKEFHIGHLVTNAIGESIARIIESSGAKKVLRVNYQGDVGMHVAMAVWGMRKKRLDLSKGSPEEKVKSLGQAYALGATSYKKDKKAQKEIVDINEKIYEQTDKEINKLYNKGRKISLDYFETIYKKLGTKFDDYFFEREAGEEGKKIISKNSKLFSKSKGAIVFKGEDYGLHTRVFLNSEGYPTYEAKELGLVDMKFKKHKPDINITITGNEIKEYFKVMLRVMELIKPVWAKKTIHIPHGMLRLPDGKMSSRTGKIIRANNLIEEVAKVIAKKMEKEDDKKSEQISIGAIKYSILKSGPGKDMIFDFDKSLSFSGDSGPYLQYTYARIQSIIRKSPVCRQGRKNKKSKVDFKNLREVKEHSLVLQMAKYPEILAKARENYDPSEVAKYLFELAREFNDYYHSVPVLKSEKDVRVARLALINSVAQVLQNGLNLLGIEVVDKM